MKIDLNKLRAETLAAIERGKEMKANKEAEDTEKEKARHKEAQAWAEMALAKIPVLAKDAASKGKSKVCVANTKKDYFAFSEREGWRCKESGLKYFLLIQELEKLGFKISVEYQHDGVGIESWHEIIIDWS